MKFDWERRSTPEGLLQIARNQKRADQDRELNQFTAQHASLKFKSQWESKQILVTSNTNTTHAPSDALPKAPRALVVDELRREEQEKRDARLAQKTGAFQRREALLQQALAGKLHSASDQFKTENPHGIKDDYPELRDHVRAASSKKLVTEWDQQVKERNERLATAKCGTVPTAAGNFLSALGQNEVDRASRIRDMLLRDLEGQVNEAERRKMEEILERTKTQQQLQEQWRRTEAAATEIEIQQREKQRHFVEGMNKLKDWRREAAAQRAAAGVAAVQERPFLADRNEEKDDDGKGEVKWQLRMEAESQLDAWMDARDRAAAAKAAGVENYAAEQRVDAEKAAQEAHRRHLEIAAITATNAALMASHSSQRDAQLQEKHADKLSADQDASKLAAARAAMKETQLASAAKQSADLGAQVAAKEERDHLQKAIDKKIHEKQREKEEERQRYITETIFSLRI